MLEIDQTTLAGWERGEHQATKRLLINIIIYPCFLSVIDSAESRIDDVAIDRTKRVAQSEHSVI